MKKLYKNRAERLIAARARRRKAIDESRCANCRCDRKLLTKTLCLKCALRQRAASRAFATSDKKQSWLRQNSARIAVQKRNRARVRRQTDVQYRLAVTLRKRLLRALHGSFRVGSAVRDLGCSIDDLRRHLTALFKPGMTWNKHGHGAGKWNIDHVYPLAKFDLTDREQLKKALHFSNLQPLWHDENMRKHVSVPSRRDAARKSAHV